MKYGLSLNFKISSDVEEPFLKFIFLTVEQPGTFPEFTTETRGTFPQIELLSVKQGTFPLQNLSATGKVPGKSIENEKRFPKK